MAKKLDKEYLRSFVFGCQDALVSTTGVVVGVSMAGVEKKIVVLTALITIAVEALSMAAGQYLSEKTIHDFPRSNHKDNLVFGAVIMFMAYILGGIIPVLPVLFFTSKSVSVMSILSAFLGLFLLGYLKAKLFYGHAFRSSTEMVVIGGLAVLMGSLVGIYLRY